MSRLMDDLNKLNEDRKIDGGIIVQDAEELKSEPVATSHKSVYFIGFLIVLILSVSAVSMAISLKTLARIGSIEKTTASTSAKVLARFEHSEEISAGVLGALTKQDGEIQAMRVLMVDQNDAELARINDLKDQVTDLRATLRERDSEIYEMKIAQGTLESLIEDSVDDLKITDALMRQRHVELSDKVKKILDTNAYIYGAY
jgi:hypothetical protein